MRRLTLIMFLAVSLFLPVVNGHPAGPDASKVLEKLFNRLLATTEDSGRIIINDSIKLIIDSYAQSDSVLTHTFTDLKYLGQVTSRNSRLKIITWNLLLKESASKYYCYIIHRSGTKNMVYNLSATYTEEPVRTDTVYSEVNWYGALYYDLRPVRKDNQIYWVLLGIDYGNPLVTRKIIDILRITPGGMIIFGHNLFVTEKERKYREVLEYSSGAVTSLKFLTDRSIVFDHLVPVSPELKDRKEYYGPDFSYDAYDLEKGLWKFKTDIDARNKK